MAQQKAKESFARKFVEQTISLIETQSDLSLGWFEEDGPNNMLRLGGACRENALRALAEAAILWLQEKGGRENIALLLQGVSSPERAVRNLFLTESIFQQVLDSRTSWTRQADVWSGTKVLAYQAICLDVLSGAHLPNRSFFSDEWIEEESWRVRVEAEEGNLGNYSDRILTVTNHTASPGHVRTEILKLQVTSHKREVDVGHVEQYRYSRFGTREEFVCALVTPGETIRVHLPLMENQEVTVHAGGDKWTVVFGDIFDLNGIFEGGEKVGYVNYGRIPRELRYDVDGNVLPILDVF